MQQLGVRLLQAVDLVLRRDLSRAVHEVIAEHLVNIISSGSDARTQTSLEDARTAAHVAAAALEYANNLRSPLLTTGSVEKRLDRVKSLMQTISVYKSIPKP